MLPHAQLTFFILYRDPSADERPASSQDGPSMSMNIMKITLQMPRDPYPRLSCILSC